MANVDELLESISSLTLVEAYELVKAIEEKYGVYLSVDSELTEVKTLDQLLTVLATRIQQGGNAPAEGAAATAENGSPEADLRTAAAAATTVGTPAAAPVVSSTPTDAPAKADEDSKAGAN